jgi:N-acetylmuramoyl-L-alanine amidase
MKVYLDPGHGGADSGEAANGILEKNVNLSVALKLKPLLIAAGLEVKQSRETDVFINVNDRPVMANSWGADLFISIHHNGGKGIGYEIYKSISGSCNDLSAKIAAEYEKLGRKPHNGGAQTKTGSDGKDYYAVIRDTNMPAILSEFCYLDSSDVTAIDSDLKQAQEAQAMASGILAHLGIKPVQVTQTPLQPVNIVAAVVPKTASPMPSGDPAVKTYQTKLNRLHIGTPLVTDGVRGPITINAVKLFQSAVGITVDGVYGSQSGGAYQAIVSKPTLKQGSTGITVRYIQYRLGCAIDGQFGAKTAAAVKAFQSRNGLSTDGIVGNLTWIKLVG